VTRSERTEQPRSLTERFGAEVELQGADGTAVYRILAELALDGRRYAILQSDAMRKEDDIEVFRIEVDPDGEPELATVEDDEEWEKAAEAYDDMQFGGDERP
jgi:uncharacterized protein YrzB (UPF0473 family)